MKSSIFFILLFFYCNLSAQDVNYAFSNAQITNAGPNGSYEVDITISTSSDFKLGSGQLYFDYNPLAFGNSIQSNSMVTITTTGYLLGQSSGPFGIYSNFIVNDNTDSRLSFSWQQALSSGCITSDNVTSTVEVLFHLRIDFAAGGSGLDPGVCFYFSAPFDDQTFTACGPGASCTFPDCVNDAGVQITNDNYDCSASAPLPVELMAFKATAQNDVVQLEWETATELDNDYFIIERSKDALSFEPIDKVDGAGTSNETQYYEYWDEQPYIGINYYRLKQVDLDGNFEYSEVRAVTIEGQSFKLSIYPNPAVERLTIETAEEQQLGRIQLFNELGQLVLEEIANDKDFRWTLEVEHLPRGVYFLRIGEQRPLYSGSIVLHSSK